MYFVLSTDWLYTVESGLGDLRSDARRSPLASADEKWRIFRPPPDHRRNWLDFAFPHWSLLLCWPTWACCNVPRYICWFRSPGKPSFKYLSGFHRSSIITHRNLWSHCDLDCAFHCLSGYPSLTLECSFPMKTFSLDTSDWNDILNNDPVELFNFVTWDWAHLWLMLRHRLNLCLSFFHKASDDNLGTIESTFRSLNDHNCEICYTVPERKNSLSPSIRGNREHDTWIINFVICILPD